MKKDEKVENSRDSDYNSVVKLYLIILSKSTKEVFL